MSHSVIFNFTNLTLDPHIKTLLLDLDNTCYEYLPCHQEALNLAHTAIEQIVGPLPLFSRQYSEAQLQVKSRIPTHSASHSRVLYFQTLFELLGRKDGHIHAVNLENTYWGKFISTMQISPGLDTFLAETKGNGTTIVVVSDLTTALQCKKIATLGIADKVDYLVTSEEVGADKPKSAPFQVALKKAAGIAAETVMIGDSHEKDILGAKALGISTIHFCYDKKNNIPSL